MTSSNQRSVQRQRFPDARRRQLIVKRVTRVTPHMVRVTLTGDLQDFNSAGYDDHVKLFFAGEGDNKRDYTPRRFDAAANELDIEFVLHGEGPATTWAAQVKAGDQLEIGGPRGSSVVTGDFDWYLLVADEAGLPAVARRLEELPAGARTFVVAEVEDASDEQTFDGETELQVTWLHRKGRQPGTNELLLDALTKLTVPPGVGYTWIATESNVARSLRRYLIDERGFDKEWLKAAGYWKLGEIAAHENHND
jgi:NADPH-dependent ferric siderophore reductase